MKYKFNNNKYLISQSNLHKDGRKRLIFVYDGEDLVCSQNEYGNDKEVDNKIF